MSPQPSQTLAIFMTKMLGKRNVGTTAANVGQCVGLVECWLQATGSAAIPGNACDLLANAAARGLETIANGPTNYPLPGDIVCWNSTWGNGYGHCAVVIAANTNWMAVLEQNDPTGSYCLASTHNYSGVSGWIVL